MKAVAMVNGCSKPAEKPEASAARWSENLVMWRPIERRAQLRLLIAASCNRLSDAAAIADMEDIVDYH
jgi:hypothetical protein